MQSFKDFADNTPPSKLSDHGEEFLAHLMSNSQPPDEAWESLQEVNLLDRKKDPKAQPSMLNHPAVAETDNPHHRAMYQSLMQRGEHLSAELPNAHKHIRAGFDSYMAGVKHGEDPRVTQRSHLSAARSAFKESQREVGYKAAGAPDFIGGNTKTAKNEAMGDITAGLTLSPASIHGIKGHNACPNSTSECRNSCLGYTTGKNAMLSNVNSKIAKHQFFTAQPEHAARLIHSELLGHIDNVAGWNKGKKGKKLIASYRPNMVTDYNHTQISGKMIEHVSNYAKSKGVKFQVRDYTKNHALLNKPRHPDYFLALSHTGSGHPESNDHHVGEALNAGHTVAAVVRGPATHMYDHKTGRLYPMVSGDEDDQIEKRHAQVGHMPGPNGTGIHPTTHKPTGVVSVLRVKGASKKVKEAAGNFENHTTMIHHPEHGPMHVVEINKFHNPNQK